MVAPSELISVISQGQTADHKRPNQRVATEVPGITDHPQRRSRAGFDVQNV